MHAFHMNSLTETDITFLTHKYEFLLTLLCSDFVIAASFTKMCSNI